MPLLVTLSKQGVQDQKKSVSYCVFNTLHVQETLFCAGTPNMSESALIAAPGLALFRRSPSVRVLLGFIGFQRLCDSLDLLDSTRERVRENISRERMVRVLSK